MRFKNIKVIQRPTLVGERVLEIEADRMGWFFTKRVRIYVGVTEWFYLHNYKSLKFSEKKQLKRWLEVHEYKY